jgi:hypothetical protein
MQLMWAYQQAAEMEAKMGMPAFAAMYKAKAAQLNRNYPKQILGWQKTVCRYRR